MCLYAVFSVPIMLDNKLASPLLICGVHCCFWITIVCLYLLVIEVRPPAFNICGCVKPILNYCSRTGEELLLNICLNGQNTKN